VEHLLLAVQAHHLLPEAMAATEVLRQFQASLTRVAAVVVLMEELLAVRRALEALVAAVRVFTTVTQLRLPAL
jgi:predicted GTPase